LYKHNIFLPLLLQLIELGDTMFSNEARMLCFSVVLFSFITVFILPQSSFELLGVLHFLWGVLRGVVTLEFSDKSTSIAVGQSKWKVCYSKHNEQNQIEDNNTVYYNDKYISNLNLTVVEMPTYSSFHFWLISADVIGYANSSSLAVMKVIVILG